MSTPRKRLTGPVHGRIRRLRERAGLTLTEFADQCDVHISVACHWENGRSRPDLSRIPKIAQVLGVSELELVRGEKAWAPYERALRTAA